jgi:carbon monoxide dehydrogenase subunit G
MASIRKELVINASPQEVWAALRDLGAIHLRLARDFVVDTQLDGESRLVTFANGVSVHELIVDVDDSRRRLAYSVTGWIATHHHASFEVLDDNEGARLLWIADLLPHDLASQVGAMMEQGCAAIKQTLEADAARAGAS